MSFLASPELLALLEAAKEAPHADGPRLVLADWLEDQGATTRAEFIRLQLQLAPGASLDPASGPSRKGSNQDPSTTGSCNQEEGTATMSEEPAPLPHKKRQRRRQIKKVRQKLALERAGWSRWMPRLKRAFHTIEKLDRRITQLERQIARLTNP
jgi:uncharacterized protein (TIGR02996 family)